MPPGEVCSTLMQLLRRHMPPLLYWHFEALWANRPVCFPDAQRKVYFFFSVQAHLCDPTETEHTAGATVALSQARCLETLWN